AAPGRGPVRPKECRASGLRRPARPASRTWPRAALRAVGRSWPGSAFGSARRGLVGLVVEIKAGAALQVGELGRLLRLPIDAQVEHVEAVVVAGDVVHLARLDAPRQIDVGVDDALGVDERFAHQPAVGPYDAREGAVLAAKHLLGLRVR